MKSLLFILITTGIILVFVQSAVAEIIKNDPGVCFTADLTVSDLIVPSEITAGDDFSCTFTVKNEGVMTSDETPIQIVLPGGITLDVSETVPPLTPGESITLTISNTIPADVSGFGFYDVILDPNHVTQDCFPTDNTVGGFMRILPVGITAKAYEKGTEKFKYYKATNKYIKKTNKR